MINAHSVVIGVGVDGCLKACELAVKDGVQVLNVGLKGESFGGQHATAKGIDKAPLLLLRNGLLSQKLVGLGVSDYLAFRPVQSITVFFAHQDCLKVPLRKEHVMLEQGIPLADKRRLMRVLTCTEVDDPKGKAYEWLISLGFSVKVIDLVAFGVCCLPDRDGLHDMSCGDFMQRVIAFYSSLPQPLLYPIHGASEICQSLARVAAVRGAIQILSQQPSIADDGLKIEYDGQCLAVDCHGQTFHCDQPAYSCQRGVLLTEDPLYGEHGIQLYVYTPTGSCPTVFALQLDSSTHCCPKYLVHFWSFCESVDLLRCRLQSTSIVSDLLDEIQFHSMEACNKFFVYY